MSLLARLVRVLVWVRFGRNSAESDIITDKLEYEVPDYKGAFQSWKTFASLRKC